MGVDAAAASAASGMEAVLMGETTAHSTATEKVGRSGAIRSARTPGASSSAQGRVCDSRIVHRRDPDATRDVVCMSGLSETCGPITLPTGAVPTTSSYLQAPGFNHY